MNKKSFVPANQCSTGVLPPYMLFELATRAGNERYLDTLSTTMRMHRRSQKQQSANPFARFAGAGNSSIEVYDCNGGESRPGSKARFEGEPATGNKDVDSAYDFTLAVRKYYAEVHGRNGIDAHGMTMVSSVNYGDRYNNAYWDGRQMTYGKGDQEIFASFVILDVAGHEVTHGVTEFEANLRYYKQAGALNESHSDIFGKMIEAYSKNQPVEQIDWVLGRGIFMPGIKGEGIRNMLKPGTAYNDARLGKDPQPDHYSKLYTGSSDNGGVHYNSGIVNRAFANWVIAMGGFEWKKGAKIWFAARAAAGSNPTFAQHAYHTVEACKALGTAADVKKLQDAWELVGVKPSNKVSHDNDGGDDVDVVA
ncbi:MAG: M4 family metallopeptidase [Candidatus Obscuribacterales bacterium]|nr:M4 family metallopeptidase [Candidatus Obscuribacterales bacterium]